jgi:hypothetical protein
MENSKIKILSNDVHKKIKNDAAIRIYLLVLQNISFKKKYDGTKSYFVHSAMG